MATPPPRSTATPPAAPKPHAGHSSGGWRKIEDFWGRVTDGLEISELWAQFRAEARAGYRLYSREVPRHAPEGATKGQRFLNMARTLFWAILMKLTPVRRVMLLLAIVLLLLPNISFVFRESDVQFPPLHFYGSLLLIALLLLEVGDRVIMKRDLEIAREIQLWLVPASAPAIPGIDLAFVNRPANTVAGDYYDVLPWEIHEGAARRKLFLLAVADVVGKSLPAALLMATFQASLRSLCATTRSLPELVNALNQYTSTNSRGGTRFTTALLAAFEPESRELVSINAGHNPPMLLRADGAIERLEKGGLPFGIQPEAAYETETRTLRPGDRLLIYTDGLTEAVNERDEEFGEARVLSWLGWPHAENAEQMLTGLMRQLSAFMGTAHQHDDITCLLLRVAP